jgi:8-oxo-dGTP diphosphatase
MSSNDNFRFNVIEAAGGLLWQETPKGLKVAIIHRPKYDDWTLPKGKREVGESWQETALREVYEETGCKAKLGSFAGGIFYLVNAVPKIVLFWHMRIVIKKEFTPNKEIDKCDWLLPEIAMNKLNYDDERGLLQQKNSLDFNF